MDGVNGVIGLSVAMEGQGGGGKGGGGGLKEVEEIGMRLRAGSRGFGLGSCLERWEGGFGLSGCTCDNTPLLLSVLTGFSQCASWGKDKMGVKRCS